MCSNPRNDCCVPLIAAPPHPNPPPRSAEEGGGGGKQVGGQGLAGWIIKTLPVEVTECC